MKISIAIPIALFLMCFLSISWAKPQEPIDPPKVIKPIPRHDELRAKPEYQLADDWDLIRVRREPQTPVEQVHSNVSVDDPIVQEAAEVFVKQSNDMKPPVTVQSATKQVTGVYTIKLQAKLLAGQPDDATCDVHFLHLPGQNPKFQFIAMACIA